MKKTLTFWKALLTQEFDITGAKADIKLKNYTARKKTILRLMGTAKVKDIFLLKTTAAAVAAQLTEFPEPKTLVDKLIPAIYQTRDIRFWNWLAEKCAEITRLYEQELPSYQKAFGIVPDDLSELDAQNSQEQVHFQYEQVKHQKLLEAIMNDAHTVKFSAYEYHPQFLAKAFQSYPKKKQWMILQRVFSYYAFEDFCLEAVWDEEYRIFWRRYPDQKTVAEHRPRRDFWKKLYEALLKCFGNISLLKVIEALLEDPKIENQRYLGTSIARIYNDKYVGTEDFFTKCLSREQGLKLLEILNRMDSCSTSYYYEQPGTASNKFWANLANNLYETLFGYE